MTRHASATFVHMKLVVVGLLAACGSEGTPADRATRTPGHARVPKVASAAVLVTNQATPPPIVILMDAKGDYYANLIARWDVLSTKDPMAGAYPVILAAANRLLAEGRAKDMDARATFKLFTDPARRLSLDDSAIVFDDEPPLEEEEDDDGPTVDWGPTDFVEPNEGKMGKTEADRVEGQYKMQPPLDPQLAAQRARDAARTFLRWDIQRAAEGRLYVPTLYRSWFVSAQRTITAEVFNDGELQRPNCLLLTAPAVSAAAMIDAIAVLRPRIAVAHGNQVRQLRLQIVPERVGPWAFEAERWIELRVGTTDLAFEAVPETPIVLTGALDQAAFAAALELSRQTRSLPPLTRVDVLVEPEVDAQRLIDILVALDEAGVIVFGLGRPPAIHGDEAEQRGVRRHVVSLGQPNAQGHLAKPLIRRSMKRSLHKVRACYDGAVKATPGLRGTVMTQFFINPNGTVATASSSGVSPELADCVTAAIRAMEFPKAGGDGGTQVNYPFTFSE